MNTVISTSQSLQGQRALVTGADSGIGAAIAGALAAAGAKVIVHSPAAAEREAAGVVNGIRAGGGEATTLAADIGREVEVEALFARMFELYGGIDILVNNAGLQRNAPFPEMSLEDWRQVLEINLTGQFLCARAAAREFIHRGVVAALSRAAGKIICMSSVHDVIPWIGHANYAAAKGGVSMLMKTLARELAPYRIRVNGIAPGAVKAAAGGTARYAAEAELLELIPYGRLGEAEDIARAVVWLASDESDYVTGTTLYVDGGMTLYPGFDQEG